MSTSKSGDINLRHMINSKGGFGGLFWGSFRGGIGPLVNLRRMRVISLPIGSCSQMLRRRIEGRSDGGTRRCALPLI